MTLEQQIQEDIKAAMKAKDTVAMNAIRAVRSEFIPIARRLIITLLLLSGK